jgi:hypothetical protein
LSLYKSHRVFEALSTLCIHMHVGELDTGWLNAMQKQATELRAAGINSHFTVEKGEQHVIRALTGEGAVRLFDEIEQDCAQGTHP